MKVFWCLFFVLLVLHQDYWNWSEEEISYLGLPIGLFYHALFSFACACLGGWAVFCAWPYTWEKYADEKDADQSGNPHSG